MIYSVIFAFHWTNGLIKGTVYVEDKSLSWGEGWTEYWVFIFRCIAFGRAAYTPYRLLRCFNLCLGHDIFYSMA